MSTPRTLVAAASVVAATGALALAGASTATASPVAGASAPVGVVTARGGLIAHRSPSTHSTRVGTYRNGERLGLDCKVVGTKVGGNRRWYTIDSDASGLIWVSARYVRNVGAVPHVCDPMNGTVRATTRTRLNNRQGPNVRDRKLGQYANGTTLHTVCWTTNEPSGGRWALTASGRWVAKRYLHLSRPLENCL
ncbi:MAG: hypothetical protein ACRDPH_14165 [Marmoricola sp.]